MTSVFSTGIERVKKSMTIAAIATALERKDAFIDILKFGFRSFFITEEVGKGMCLDTGCVALIYCMLRGANPNKAGAWICC